MIAYLTKQFQAVPALAAVHQSLGGHFVSTRYNTVQAIHKFNPAIAVDFYLEKLGRLTRGFRTLDEARVIVTGAPYSKTLSRLRGKKYMIFTGTSAVLTASQIREDHAHFDKLCVLGPRMMRTVEKAGLDIPVVQAGYFPFLLFPPRKSAACLQVLQTAGIDCTQKIVLYLPRGEPYGSFDMMMPRFMTQLPQTGMTLIVRPHPSQSVKLHLRDRLRFLAMHRHLGQHANIVMDMNRFRLADLLAVADLVITDGNSPAEESLFYDVPQILIETPRLSKKIIHDRMKAQAANAEDIHAALRTFDNGPTLTPDEQDIAGRIDDAIASAADYAGTRQDNYHFVFGARGFDAQRAVIEELRQLDA